MSMVQTVLTQIFKPPTEHAFEASPIALLGRQVRTCSSDKLGITVHAIEGWQNAVVICGRARSDTLPDVMAISL